MIGLHQTAKLGDVAFVPCAHFRQKEIIRIQIFLFHRFRNAERRIVRRGRSQNFITYRQNLRQKIFDARLSETARDADLRHTQTDGSAALLLCGAAVELGGPNGRIVRKRHFECLFQRQRPPLFLCGELHDGRQGEHNQRDFFHIFYTYDVAKIEIIRFKCVFVRTKRTFLVRLVHFFSIRGDRGGR